MCNHQVTDLLRITNGRVFDPTHGVDGEVRDVWVNDGRVIDPPSPDTLRDSVRTIDARGCVVMPGGVEMHAHLASMPVNAARMIQSHSGYDTVVPSAPMTGRLYAQLGYTTGIEAAVPPGAAAVAHMQLDDLPFLDAGVLVLMGNHEAVIERLSQGDRAGTVAVVRDLLATCGGFGIKAVNPGGVAAWRRRATHDRIASIDDAIGDTGVTPRALLDLFTEAQEQLDLPHATHIHGPQLGEPGAVDITLDLMRSLKGRRFHLAHLQYYAYGRTAKGGFVSAAERLAEQLRKQRDATFDMGLVAFGPAFTATADLPLEYNLYRSAGSPLRPAYFCESANEDCFGVMPLVHKAGNPIHAMQWATGLELALLADPWQCALSLDHPNGGSFLNYPELIAMLMSKARRDEQRSKCHKHATDRTGLASIVREMTLTDIALATRAAPARALGLKNKGHLGTGADADVTIYNNQTDDPQSMFARPRWVIKAGRVIVDDGECVDTMNGKRLRAAVDADEQGTTLLRDWRQRHGYPSAGAGLAAHEIERMNAVTV